MANTASARPDPIEVAQELIRINSVNPDLIPDGPGEAEIAEWCAQWFAAQGFEVHRLGNAERPTVVGVVRGTGGGRSLMLNGHLDTVGVAGYEGDPFAAQLRDGKLFGRGAFDMKAGVAAIMVSAARAKAAKLAGDVIVTLVADEEFGSLGTEDALAAFTADAAIVTEPTEMNLVLAHRGFAWFTIELTGVAAHGSMPEQGVDAIVHAGLVLRAIDELQAEFNKRPAHPLLGHSSVRVATISGGSDAATVAGSCTLTIESRTLPGETPDSVEAELRGILGDIAMTTPHFRYDLRRLVARSAFEADPEWPIVLAVKESGQSIMGCELPIRGEPYWTDAGLLHDAGIPCLLIGVDGGGAHAGIEWATVDSIATLTDLLEDTIREFCA
jgi:succinyl-diaminopimelate desuccinylase